MSDPNTKHSGRRGEGMRRRDFLALGAATAAASAMSASGASSSLLVERSPLGVDLLAGEPISVGYVVGSDEWWQTPTASSHASGPGQSPSPLHATEQ